MAASNLKQSSQPAGGVGGCGASSLAKQTPTQPVPSPRRARRQAWGWLRRPQVRGLLSVRQPSWPFVRFFVSFVLRNPL